MGRGKGFQPTQSAKFLYRTIKIVHSNARMLWMVIIMRVRALSGQLITPVP
jgi:hypothetical protein